MAGFSNVTFCVRTLEDCGTPSLLGKTSMTPNGQIPLGGFGSNSQTTSFFFKTITDFCYLDRWRRVGKKIFQQLLPKLI